MFGLMGISSRLLLFSTKPNATGSSMCVSNYYHRLEMNFTFLVMIAFPKDAQLGATTAQDAARAANDAGMMP